MRRVRPLALAGLALSAIAVGCGGGNEMAAPATTPAPEPAAYPSGSTGGAPAPAVSEPMPAPGMAQPQAALSQARGQLEEAQRELETSAGDCAAACRALGSMERAAAHLCALADQPDDRRRCDDAKRKVYAARDRVRQTCNTCPGGPSLDPNAPIPSTGP
jgi:hypothetical protein